MLMRKVLVLGCLMGLLTASQVQAQVTVDVAKITCDQFIQHKITTPRYIAIWLSGFYAGKRNELVVDVQKLEQNAADMLAYCVLNREVLLTQAVENVLGAGK